MAAEPIISFRKADILGGEQTVIYGLDMDIYPADFVYIMGKVGTGKTSIIRTIIAESPLKKGDCSACGYDIRKIKAKEIPYLRRKFGVVFQDFQLLTDRDVYSNLEFVLKATGWRVNEKIDNRIEDVLEAVGMQTKRHKMPHQLSGGEQQRVAIARCLLNNPDVILADEPTGNLDHETADGIMQLLCNLNKSEHTAVVMVTHDQSLPQRFPGRVFICENEECRERA